MNGAPHRALHRPLPRSRHRSLLLAYQLATGLSDTLTGIALVVAPAQTLRLLALSAPPAGLPYLSFCGAFVLAVGVSGLYGAWLVRGLARGQGDGWAPALRTVWILTGLLRGSAAAFLVLRMLTGEFEAGWSIVAGFDGVCVLVQAAGLGKGWLSDAR